MATAIPPRHLVIFGRPGSGKSSLAERLGADFGYQLVRTGEMLREAVRQGGFLGSRVEQHLVKGDLVPDRLIFELLEARLTSPESVRLLFDGFPRTMGQVDLLAGFERKLGFAIECYLDVEVSRDESVARMTGRRVCPACGATYHTIARPPKVAEVCDNDGATLERRKDDTMDVVGFRQRLYDEQTEPVVAHYRSDLAGRFRPVDGEQGLEAVYRDARRALGVPLLT